MREGGRRKRRTEAMVARKEAGETIEREGVREEWRREGRERKG